MNNPHVERAQGHAYYAQYEQRGLTERQIDAALAQAEATLAIVYELRQNRQQAEQGPSHTGAAFLIPGALVAVNNPRSEWYGMTGTITHTGHGITTVRFPGNNTHPIANQHLTKAEQS